MFKALLLVFDPTATWERIFRSRRGVPYVLVTHLLPLLALTSIAEGFRLAHWQRPGDIRPLAALPIGQVVLFEAGQFLLLLAVVFISAELLKWVAENVRGQRTYTQAFTTVAYGLAPLFLLRFLDALKNASPWEPWVSWAVGIVLSLAVLYHGVPRMMEPSPPHAFGLYVISATLLILTSGLVRLVTFSYLQGRFSKLEAMVSAAAARLPF